jgi:hypothetical protein
MGKSSRGIVPSSFVVELKHDIYDAVVRYFAPVVAIYSELEKTAHLRGYLRSHPEHGFENEHHMMSPTTGVQHQTDEAKSLRDSM